MAHGYSDAIYTQVVTEHHTFVNYKKAQLTQREARDSLGI